MYRNQSCNDECFQGSIDLDGQSLSTSSAAPVVCLIDRDLTVLGQITDALTEQHFVVHSYESVREFRTLDNSVPDCLMVDFARQNTSLSELQNLLGTRHGCIAPVIITGSGNVGDAVRYMKAGAADYLAKPLNPTSLLDCIRRTSTIGRANRTKAAPLLAAKAKIDLLTRRERQVLDLLIGGCSHRAVSEELHISKRTAELYRARIKTKLEAKNFVDVLHIALLAAQLPPKRGD